MIKKIRIDQLTPGMFVHDLNCGWLDHPFLKNQFAVGGQGMVDRIRAIGVREVYIDTEKGSDVVFAPTEKEVSAELERRIVEIALEPPKRVKKPIPAQVAEEGPRARRMYSEANRIVQDLLEDTRLGKQIHVERLEPMIEHMVDSIFRNQDALLHLARLKSHDSYTFEHSVSVCALMVSFARGLKLPREAIRDIAMGALLHDVGKACVPDRILNKPAKLTEDEFARMKSHVAQGVDLLEDTPGIGDISLQVAGQHHERFDGTGYPHRLKGGEISLYGQMAAIVDVYDAISSDRVYHKGMPPTQALKKLLEWSEHHFDPALVQSFIRAIGIYPAGTLVRLASGRLGVVVEQNEGSLLTPVVRIFYHAGRQHYLPPELVNLARSQDRIASFESFEKWKIDPRLWLPG